MSELNLNEMESVSGGQGGFPNPLPPKEGLKVYRIQSGDTLVRIARDCKTTVEYLMVINPTISNRKDITPGFYIYVPA